jgi:hypothetical protein
VHIIADSLKKNLTQIPDPNPEKGHFLYLDNARPRFPDHEIQANNLIRLSHPAHSLDLAPAGFWPFGYLKVMVKGSSFETAEEMHEKVTNILMSIPTSTSEQYLRNGKVDCSDALKQVESIFKNAPSQRSAYIAKRDKLGTGLSAPQRYSDHL